MPAHTRSLPLSERLYQPPARYTALCALVVFAFLLGGGSRADIMSLVLLRPLTIFLGAYALIVVTRKQLAGLGAPVWLVLALMVLALLQLIPLPPGVWVALPGRELVTQVSRDLGLADTWRPLTLAAGRTTNTLFALTLPLAVFLLVAIQAGMSRDALIRPLLAAGAVSAVLGLAQIVLPADGPLYLYRITNSGAAVGLFANRNHNAMFLASLIPLLGYVAMRAWGFGIRRVPMLAACAGGILFLIPMILVIGSRAGAVIAAAMLLSTAALWWMQARKGSSGRRSQGVIERWGGVLVFGAAGLLAVVTYGLSRSVVSQRLSDESLGDELRVNVMPHLFDMVGAYFPVGSGLGSFDLAYKVIEPDSLLQTQFLNQAHNDLLQLLIEGGLPAALILLIGGWWLLRAGLHSWRAFQHSIRDPGRRTDPAIFAFLSLSALLVGGLVDYPLRTPALMCAAALLCCVIERSRRATAQPVRP